MAFPPASLAGRSSIHIEEEARAGELESTVPVAPSIADSKQSVVVAKVDVECSVQGSKIRMPEKFDEMSFGQISLVLFR